MAFTEEEIERYSRQIVLPRVGGLGQEKLRKASVLVVGAGGLGSPVLYYLAAAGVGRLYVMDDEDVELSNLHRQILHHSNEVGSPKTATAAARIRELNPAVQVKQIHARLDLENVWQLVQEMSVVVDGSDNLETKFHLNDACVIWGTPLIHGGVIRFDGQVTTILPGAGPCLRCLFADADRFESDTLENCSQVGVLGAAAGVIGTIQATEALKVILGIGEPLVGRMLVIDMKENRVRTVRFQRREGCPVCGMGQAL